jgi:copper chaperone NosL
MGRAETILSGLLTLVALSGCAKHHPQPVDIFPEDNCSLCKMAISDIHLASEILMTDGEAKKFDDIGCLQKYRRMRTDLGEAEVFYKDWATARWLTEHEAVVLETGASTPMGSGLVAFADSLQARAFLNDHPVPGLAE